MKPTQRFQIEGRKGHEVEKKPVIRRRAPLPFFTEILISLLLTLQQPEAERTGAVAAAFPNWTFPPPRALAPGSRAHSSYLTESCPG